MTALWLIFGFIGLYAFGKALSDKTIEEIIKQNKH